MTIIDPTSTLQQPVPRPIDPDELMAFVFRTVDEVGATLNTALVVMGDELGYHRAQSDGRPTTATELAERAGTSQDSPRERLTARAAGDHVTYDATTERYTLPAEHAASRADEPRPAWRARNAGSPARVREVATAARFGRLRPGAATPLDSVFEVRPGGTGPTGSTTGGEVMFGNRVMSRNSRGAGSRSRVALGRRVAAGLTGAAVAVVLATPAAAARPGDPACLGNDIRSYAQGGALFGGFVSGMAATGQGVGAEIQAHRAGQIPDEALPNSCND